MEATLSEAWHGLVKRPTARTDRSPGLPNFGTLRAEVGWRHWTLDFGPWTHLRDSYDPTFSRHGTI